MTASAPGTCALLKGESLAELLPQLDEPCASVSKLIFDLDTRVPTGSSSRGIRT